jgi:uncharacterized damage-inducible protein DinB
MVEPSKSFQGALDQFKGQFVALAKAMPADKYAFAPSAAIFVPSQKTDYLSPNNQGVRSFGQMVAHVAQANYFYGGRIGGGMKPDVDVKAIGELKEKDAIVAALEKSFDFASQAMGTLTPQNAFEVTRGTDSRVSLAGGVIAHGFDHYGQLAEYLRMNGVVPPASDKPAPPAPAKK